MSRPSQILSVATALLNAALVSLEHVSSKEEFEEAMQNRGEYNDSVQSVAVRLALDCLCAAVYTNDIGTVHYVHSSEKDPDLMFSRCFPFSHGPKAFLFGAKDSLAFAAELFEGGGGAAALSAAALLTVSPVNNIAESLGKRPIEEEKGIVIEHFASPKIEVPAEEVAGE